MSGLREGAGKWSFLVMLILCGIFYMVFLDPEKIYARALGELCGREPEERTAQSQVPPEGSVSLGDAGREDGAGSEAGAEGIRPDAVLPQEPAPAVLDRRDPGEVIYTSVGDDYFEDALFIGDSRVVGMFEYGGLEETATFYAETGLTIYRLLETEVAAGADGEKATIEEALGEHRFGKIYLMVGINELGTGTADTFLEKYREVVEHIQELQPDAVIYIQGILKVTEERSAQGDYITNEGIRERNEGLAQMVDNVRTYYLDVNSAVCGEDGGLIPSYTYDGVHLKAQYIPLWKEYLENHVVENVPRWKTERDEPVSLPE